MVRSLSEPEEAAGYRARCSFRSGRRDGVLPRGARAGQAVAKVAARFGDAVRRRSMNSGTPASDAPGVSVRGMIRSLSLATRSISADVRVWGL